MMLMLCDLHVPFPKRLFRLHQSLELVHVIRAGRRMSAPFVTAPWQVAGDCYACLLWYWHLAGQPACCSQWRLSSLIDLSFRYPATDANSSSESEPLADIPEQRPRWEADSRSVSQENLRFITVLTRVRHCTLSWARRIQSTT